MGLAAARRHGGSPQDTPFSDKNISKDDLKKMMEGFAAQLGVKRQFCHVDEQYEKDDKKQKTDGSRNSSGPRSRRAQWGIRTSAQPRFDRCSIRPVSEP